MTRAWHRPIWWFLISLYVYATYATLGIMPAVWKWLNAVLGGKGLLLQYVIYSLTGIGILTYVLFIRRGRTLMRLSVLFLSVGVFLVMVKFEKNPGEKIHMAQYGLLGVMLYRALRIDLDRRGWRLYLYASLFCVAIGAIDEVIQIFLPNRFFTWHDVFINGASGILALVLIRFVILVPRPRTPLA